MTKAIYQQKYNVLIAKAQLRNLDRAQLQQLTDERIERHHIKPSCLGGSDHKTNLVYLTRSEHIRAHEYLAKIYPKHPGLKETAKNMKLNIWPKRNVKLEEIVINQPTEVKENDHVSYPLLSKQLRAFKVFMIKTKYEILFANKRMSNEINYTNL